MHGVLTGYGVYFNRRHRRHGHVTQGRYGAKLVEGNEYLLKLSRYVHLNPVEDKEDGSPAGKGQTVVFAGIPMEQLSRLSFRRTSRKQSPEAILDTVAQFSKVKREELSIRQRDSASRAVASRMLCRYGGLTQREVAQTSSV